MLIREGQTAMKETFGRRLQRLREQAGFSQPRLAGGADVPLGTLRNLEQDRRVPRLDTAAALAAALGIGLDELAGDSFAVPAKKPRKKSPRGRLTGGEL
jgi:transcriptional regulator with XRE-family HTH domain